MMKQIHLNQMVRHLAHNQSLKYVCIGMKKKLFTEGAENKNKRLSGIIVTLKSRAVIFC